MGRLCVGPLCITLRCHGFSIRSKLLPVAGWRWRMCHNSITESIAPWKNARRSIPDHRPHWVSALCIGGFTEILAPQCATWEVLCGGNSTRHDICLSFPTGSGKTLAYTLPILQHLIQSDPEPVHCLRAIILLPTKPLMDQVMRWLSPLCRDLHLRLGCLGQDSLAAEMQMLRMACERSDSVGWDGTVDILLSTPGRLVTHLDHTYGFSLRHLRFLVLDEADHLMKRRHRDCLPLLIRRSRQDTSTICMEGQRLQKIVVSATVSHDVHQLKLLELHAPRMICSEGGGLQRYQFPIGLRHQKVIVPAPLRPLALVGLLHQSPDSRIIVFCSTTDMSQKLTEMLKNVQFLNEKVVEGCGDLSRNTFKKSLKRFRQSGGCVLVASDVMARGLDMKDVDCVISYDAPTHSKTYVHRVGRTARLEQRGVAVSLLRKAMDEKAFSHLTAKLGIVMEQRRLTVEDLKPLKGEVDAALDAMTNKRRRT